MAQKGGSAPASVAEGLNTVVSSIAACLTAPDAGPHIAFLQQLLQATVGQIQKGNQPQGQKPPGGGGPPGGAPPGAGGAAGPGGTSIGQLMGGAPQGPSAGPQGGPSSTGASQEDIRRMVGAQAGTAS